MFVQARNYTKGPRNTPIRLLVVHTMESAEKPGTAKAVADWFAGPDAPQASAHYCIDSQQTVQCVKDSDIAWAAPNANHDGLHLEHAGRASQRAKDWADAYSTLELLRSASLAAKKASRYNIPVRRLTPAQVKAGLKGFCGHVDVTNAYPGSGTHQDPGPQFPWVRYLGYVKTFQQGKPL